MKRIDSIKNEQVKAWKKLHTRKGREKAGNFLIEGYHLIEEALKAGMEVEAILVTDEAELPFEWENEKLIFISQSVMKELSETESPQGVIALCKLRRLTEVQNNLTGGKYLLLDRIQDPGNLGTIVRTADSAGMTAVIVGEGSVDLYNSKVIRASQGSIFHIPIYKGTLTSWMEQFKEKGIPIYGTALEGAVSYQLIEPQANFALVMGNEGEGVAKNLLAQTDKNIFIPIYGQAESLNVAVATGILLYALQEYRL